jgi:hypothetical protein
LDQTPNGLYLPDTGRDQLQPIFLPYYSPQIFWMLSEQKNHKTIG